MRLLLCLVAAWLGAGGLLAAAQATPYTYNSFMASLSTAPQPFAGAHGHYHALTAEDLPALATTNAQLLLVTLKECSAFAPHYQTDTAETLYVKSGAVDVVLVVDGQAVQQSLRRGDLVAVPRGTLHAFSNWGCDEAELVVVLSSANPTTFFPADQLLAMPEPAQISSFGISNFSEFDAAIKVPRGHIYSLNDDLCEATCAAAAANASAAADEGEQPPPDDSAYAGEAPTPARGPARSSGSSDGSKPSKPSKPSRAPAPAPRRSLLGGLARRLLGAAGPGRDARQAASAQAAPARLPGRSLAATVPERSPYNDYMAPLSSGPLVVDNEWAEQRRLSYKELSGLEGTGTQALFTRFHPCSSSVPHFQPSADEFVTVVAGTLDMILVVNGTRRLVRTMQPGDVAVIPTGVVSYFANANCHHTGVLTVRSARGSRVVLPTADLAALPEEVLTAALGLRGGLAAFPAWADTVDVPQHTLVSLNDPQCTARCDGGTDDGAAAGGGDKEQTQVLAEPGTGLMRQLPL